MEGESEAKQRDLADATEQKTKSLSKQTSGEKIEGDSGQKLIEGQEKRKSSGDLPKGMSLDFEEGAKLRMNQDVSKQEASKGDASEKNKTEIVTNEKAGSEKSSAAKKKLEAGEGDSKNGNGDENMSSGHASRKNSAGRGDLSKKSSKNIDESKKSFKVDNENAEEEKQNNPRPNERAVSEKSLQDLLGQHQKSEGEFHLNKEQSSRMALSKTSQSDKRAEDLARIFAQVKKSRIQIETDAKVLANRISLLQQEELRTLKKIKETRTKADEIYRMKKDNNLKSKLKNDEMEQTRQKLRSSQLNTLEIRKQRKEHQQAIMEAYVSHKKDEMNAIKKESDELKNKRNELAEQIKLEKLSKTHYIKKGLILGSLKMQEFKKTKVTNMKKEYLERIDQEKELSKSKENEVLQMERLELDLIKNLQQTQALQKNTYDELEDALNLPLGEYEEKYNRKAEEGLRSEKPEGEEKNSRNVSVKKKKKKRKKSKAEN